MSTACHGMRMTSASLVMETVGVRSCDAFIPVEEV
jgi:hypothetical protein